MIYRIILLLTFAAVSSSIQAQTIGGVTVPARQQVTLLGNGQGRFVRLSPDGFRGTNDFRTPAGKILVITDIEISYADTVAPGFPGNNNTITDGAWADLFVRNRNSNVAGNRVHRIESGINRSAHNILLSGITISHNAILEYTTGRLDDNQALAAQAVSITLRGYLVADR